MLLSKKQKLKSSYEIAFFVLLVLNALLLVYFILKLTQIESLARNTQIQAAQLLNYLSE